MIARLPRPDRSSPFSRVSRACSAAAPLLSGLAVALVSLFLFPSIAHAAEDCSTAVASAGGSNTGIFASALARGPIFAIGAAILGGLGVAATPCVYPMIAITVSVFGARETKSRGQAAALSGVFVLGIVVLFTALGVGSALAGGVFGSLLANKFVVFFLATLFFALASSMFGAFELALPASLNNKLATMGGAGYGGAFMLGLVSALVAAPCTGPVLTGILVWIGSTHNLVLGTAVMAAFAIGLGVPFFLVGTFAVALPKGGAWMVGVKWVFGVALAVVGLYFLRNAVRPLQIPVRSTALLAATTGAILIGLVLAAVHLAAERRKSPIAHLSKPMKLVSLPFAIGGFYLLVCFVLTPRGELNWFDREPIAREMASTSHKPVIVDFGATWCAACNELTKTTFADAEVRAEASRFVAIRVDATDEDNKEIAEVKSKYGVVGLPTVVVYDSCGRERARFNEFVDADRFLGTIKAVD